MRIIKMMCKSLVGVTSLVKILQDEKLNYISEKMTLRNHLWFSCALLLLDFVTGVRCDTDEAALIVPIIIIVVIIIVCCSICKKIYQCSQPKETVVIQTQPARLPQDQRFFVAQPTYAAPAQIHAPSPIHAPPPPYNSLYGPSAYQQAGPSTYQQVGPSAAGVSNFEPDVMPSAPPAYSEAVGPGHK